MALSRKIIQDLLQFWMSQEREIKILHCLLSEGRDNEVSILFDNNDASSKKMIFIRLDLYEMKFVSC